MSYKQLMPYAQHHITESDIALVNDVLRSDKLTGGKYVEAFEKAIKKKSRAAKVFAVNSGTAALQCALKSVDFSVFQPYVLVPAMTFAATANVVRLLGKIPIIVDVNPHTLLMDADDAAKKLDMYSGKVCAVITVDYAGQHVDYAAFNYLCRQYNTYFISDACHSFGRFEGMEKADIACFSFHPAKLITTGEGGAFAYFNKDLADHLTLDSSPAMYRNHGISVTAADREKSNDPLFYNITTPGYNFRMPDINAALGLAQMKHVNQRLKKREELAQKYLEQLFDFHEIRTIERVTNNHAWHLFVVRVDKRIRNKVYTSMRNQNIGVNIHYPSLTSFSAYMNHYCPNANEAADEIITLPLHTQMSTTDVVRICTTLKTIVQEELSVLF